MVELSRRINRPSVSLPYFFNAAIQFSTTVMGVGADRRSAYLSGSASRRGRGRNVYGSR
jgi:hypothetical protein